MSYNVSAFYVAETFIKNRLDALLKPIVRNLSGGNAPLIKSNDIMCRVFAEKSSSTGNKVGKICVKRPILRPRSMSSYSQEDFKRVSIIKNV